MIYGKILTYKDIEEARKLIGKKVIASDVLRAIENNPSKYQECILLDVIEDEFSFVFKVKYDLSRIAYYQFIREII